MKPTVINYFGTGSDAGDYSFLSNFYEHNGWTVEHYFQAAKTDSSEWRECILNAPSPGLAKKFGRKAPIRSTWDREKVAVMKSLLQKKFAPGSELAQKLLDTGDAQLIEGNWWGDRFWGVCDGKGKNWLGRLLMEVRKELKGTYV